MSSLSDGRHSSVPPAIPLTKNNTPLNGCGDDVESGIHRQRCDVRTQDMFVSDATGQGVKMLHEEARPNAAGGVRVVLQHLRRGGERENDFTVGVVHPSRI